MIFLAAILMIILSIFLGHANLAKHVFKNNYMRSFGRMAFDAGLASPIVITSLYFGQEQSVFLTDPISTVFGAGHIACNLLLAFVLFILVEYPLRSAVTVFILPKISHTDLLRKWHRASLP